MYVCMYVCMYVAVVAAAVVATFVVILNLNLNLNDSSLNSLTLHDSTGSFNSFMNPRRLSPGSGKLIGAGAPLSRWRRRLAWGTPRSP